MTRDDGVLGECDVTVNKGNLLHSLFKYFYTIKTNKMGCIFVDGVASIE